MNEVKDINGKPAVRLYDVIIKISLNVKAFMVTWQGAEIWVPKSISRDNKDGTFDVQEWFYNRKIKSDAE